jgi:membrane-bound lytic murein transglycosylase D
MFIFKQFFLKVLLVTMLFSCQQSIPNQDYIVEKVIIKESQFVVPELPKEMTFAGKKIVLEDEDLIEKLDKEVLINTYLHSTTIQILKRANRWFPLIEKILMEEGVPDDFKYLAVIESGLTQATSPKGAQGFWQFMPQTAKEFGLVVNHEIDERLHIEKSTRAACKYIINAQKTMGDWLLTSASYNRGIGGIKSDLSWQGSDDFFDAQLNSETSRYIFRLLAFKLIFENPDRFGFPIDKMNLYKPYETKEIQVRESIPNLAEWALNKGINIKILLKLNPWLKTNQLTIKNNTLFLLLPNENFNLKPYKEYLK